MFYAPPISTDFGDDLNLLRTIVRAFEEVLPKRGVREPLDYFRGWQGGGLRHFSLEEPVAIDETVLEELHDRGFISIEYLQRNQRITPTPEGRALVAHMAMVEDREPLASITELTAAVEAQAASENRMAWPAVRPVLLAIRHYWEAGGFPPQGFSIVPLIEAVEEGHRHQFRATIRQLIAGDYLENLTVVDADDLPAVVGIGPKAFTVLDGWPGASGQELAENLVAVLTERARVEEDPKRKRRLEAARDNIREIGVQVTSDVLSRVLLGGAGLES